MNFPFQVYKSTSSSPGVNRVAKGHKHAHTSNSFSLQSAETFLTVPRRGLEDSGAEVTQWALLALWVSGPGHGWGDLEG